MQQYATISNKMSQSVTFCDKVSQCAKKVDHSPFWEWWRKLHCNFEQSMFTYLKKNDHYSIFLSGTSFFLSFYGNGIGSDNDNRALQQDGPLSKRAWQWWWKWRWQCWWQWRWQWYHCHLSCKRAYLWNYGNANDDNGDDDQMVTYRSSARRGTAGQSCSSLGNLQSGPTLKPVLDHYCQSHFIENIHLVNVSVLVFDIW